MRARRCFLRARRSFCGRGGAFAGAEELLRGEPAGRSTASHCPRDFLLAQAGMCSPEFQSAWDGKGEPTRALTRADRVRTWPVIFWREERKAATWRARTLRDQARWLCGERPILHREAQASERSPQDDATCEHARRSHAHHIQAKAGSGPGRPAGPAPAAAAGRQGRGARGQGRITGRGSAGPRRIGGPPPPPSAARRGAWQPPAPPHPPTPSA